MIKQRTAYEMRIIDWSSDVCSSDLRARWCASSGLDRLRQGLSEGWHGQALSLWLWRLWPCHSTALFHQSPVLAGPGLRLCDRAHQGRRRHGLWLVSGRQAGKTPRSEEHTSELQSLMRTSYAVFCLKKKNKQ